MSDAVSNEALDKAFQEVAQSVIPPDLIQCELKILHQFQLEGKVKLRADVLTFLEMAKDLPGECIVQLTKNSCTLLVDEENNLLRFQCNGT